jgi:hypothetical protein
MGREDAKALAIGIDLGTCFSVRLQPLLLLAKVLQATICLVQLNKASPLHADRLIFLAACSAWVSGRMDKSASLKMSR